MPILIIPGVCSKLGHIKSETIRSHGERYAGLGDAAAFRIAKRRSIK